MRRAAIVIAALAVGALAEARAYADEPVKGETSVAAAAAAATPAEPAAPIAGAEEADAPPPQAPRSKGVVVESSMGVLGFAGKFRNVAPPGLHLTTNAGYELFRWLMVFGYGELAMTDSSNANGPTKQRAFPIYGFGAGGRVTVHASPRVAVFVQGQFGFMKADVPENALQILGYMDAERLRPAFDGRLGVEWYQVNRHLALGVNGGVRLATGFAKTVGSDTPLAYEGAAAIRYTF